VTSGLGLLSDILHSLSGVLFNPTVNSGVQAVPGGGRVKISSGSPNAPRRLRLDFSIRI
jgi:hypothetical protein